MTFSRATCESFSFFEKLYIVPEGLGIVGLFWCTFRPQNSIIENATALGVVERAPGALIVDLMASSVSSFFGKENDFAVYGQGIESDAVAAFLVGPRCADPGVKRFPPTN